MIDKIIDDFKINFLINIYTQMQSYIAHALGLSTGIFPCELRILLDPIEIQSVLDILKLNQYF